MKNLFLVLTIFSLLIILTAPPIVLANHNSNNSNNIGNFSIDVNGTANDTAASLSLSGNTKNDGKELKLFNISGNLTIGNDTFSLVESEGKVKGNQIKLEAETNGQEGELKLEGNLSNGNITLSGKFKIENETEECEDEDECEDENNEILWLLNFSGTSTGLNISNNKKLQGNFSLNAAGTGNGNSSTFNLTGTFEGNGNSHEIKLKNFNGTLTVGNNTFTILANGKGQGQLKLENGKIQIEAKVSNSVKGELKLKGTVNNITLTDGNLTGTFSLSLVGKLNLNKKNPKVNLNYTSESSSISFFS